MKVKTYILLLISLILSFLTSCVSRENFFDLSLDTLDPEMILAFPGGEFITEVFVPKYETFTIDNKGEKDLSITGLVISKGDITQFELDRSNITRTVEPGGSTSFKITFKPTKELGSNVEVTLTSNDPEDGLYTFTVHGFATKSTKGLRGPDAIIKPENIEYPVDGNWLLDFGMIQTGNKSLPARFTIENVGDYELTIYDLYISDRDRLDFNINDISTSDVIEPGGSTTFDISFMPGSKDQKKATVNLLSDDPDSENYSFLVKGIGSDDPVPDINVRIEGENQDLLSISQSKPYDFGTVSISLPKSLTFSIMNAGTELLNIYNILSDTQEFYAEGSTSFTLEPGTDRIVEIKFEPTTATTTTATISISSDDPDELVYEFDVTGTGDAADLPYISVLQDGIVVLLEIGYDFGKIVENVQLTKEFTIENTGNTDLDVSSITLEDIDGNFSLNLGATPPPWTIGYGVTTYTFEITFTPLSPGEKLAEIIIANNALDYITDGFRFTVMGIGQPDKGPIIEVWQDSTHINGINSFDFNEIVGTTTVYGISDPLWFVIKNTGTQPLEIADISWKTGTTTIFIIDSANPSFYIEPDKEKSFSVTFNPVDDSLETAELEISCNDQTNKTVNIVLSGSGTY